jgi:hypothetical protein
MELTFQQFAKILLKFLPHELALLYILRTLPLIQNSEEQARC